MPKKSNRSKKSKRSKISKRSNRSKISKRSKIRGGLVSRQNIERMLERESERDAEITRSQMIDEEATRTIVEVMEGAFQQIGTLFPNDIYTNDNRNRICDFIIVNKFELDNINIPMREFNSHVLWLINYFQLIYLDIPRRVMFNLVLKYADILANARRLDIFMSREGFNKLNNLFMSKKD